MFDTMTAYLKQVIFLIISADDIKACKITEHAKNQYVCRLLCYNACLIITNEQYCYKRSAHAMIITAVKALYSNRYLRYELTHRFMAIHL